MFKPLKGMIKVCPLPYSNHLRRHWEPGLIRPLMKSKKKLPNYWASASAPCLSSKEKYYSLVLIRFSAFI